MRLRHPRTDLLGMTSPEERAWLYWYASREYTGAGEIVDLGCWFGSSTIPLAQGLEQNAQIDRGEEPRARIHAYDLFIWEAWMEESVAGSRLAGALRPGDDFLPQFAARLEPWRERVVAHPGDLRSLGWGAAEPIELIFNDASKSWGLANAILRDFYPSLIVGRSLVVEQDFAHYFTPWIHLIRDRFRDYFQPVVHIPYSGSMVFQLVRAIPRELLARPFGFDDFGPEEVERAFTSSLSLVDPPMRPNVWAARVMWEVHQGKLDVARQLLAEAPRRGFRGLDLEKVRPLVDR